MTSATRRLSLILFLGASWLPAQKPVLLKDINRLSPKGAISSTPRPGASQTFMGTPSFAKLGKSLIVVARTEAIGRELFVTQGSPATTRALLDIAKGQASSDPASVTVTRDGKQAFFSATDGRTGRELWITNGTAAGTRLVKDLVKGGASSSPHKIVPIGSSQVLFVATTPATEDELFISDGTAKGTHLLKDIVPGTGGGSIGDLRTTRDGKHVFFRASAAAMGPELWVSDGTTRGTYQVLELDPTRAGVDPRHFTPLGASQMLFLANTPKAGLSVWASDGTKKGTRLLHAYAQKTAPAKGFFHAIALGDRVLFNGYTAQTGFEPWFTDGTAKGTGLLADTFGGPVSGDMISPILDSSGKHVYFWGFVGTRFFSAYRLFVTNGTFLGTRPFSPGLLTRPSDSMVESQGRVWFEGQDVTARTGAEIAVTDGTVAGTRTVKDIGFGKRDGGAGFLTRLDGSTVVFVANDGRSGEELWADKRGASPTLIDINNPTLKVTGSAWPRSLERFGDKLLFSAYDGLTSSTPYITDGTFRGTRDLPFLRPKAGSNVSNAYVALGDKILFKGFSAKTGLELFISDGTEAGTHLLADLVVGADSSDPRAFTRAGPGVFFWAKGSQSTYVPWFTDGTSQGTVALLTTGYKDPPQSGVGSRFVGLGDRIVFLGRDAAHGMEPWVTDGTRAGTRLLKDINPGTADGRPLFFTVSGGRIFFQAQEPRTGKELWTTDGTAKGTHLVVDLYPGRNSSWPIDLCARNGRIYFRGSTSTGFKIFESDGTAKGTKVFVDPAALKIPDYVTQLTAVGSRRVYFQTANGIGKKLYISDGTTAGTRILTLDTGLGISYRGYFPYPHYRLALGSQVFLPGKTASVGLELFSIDNGATAEPVGAWQGSTWLEGNDPILGKTATVSVGTDLQNAVHVLLMGRLSAAPQRIASSGWSLLDLSGPLFIASATTGPRATTSLSVPASPTFQGLHLAFQSWSFDARHLAGTLELSNALEWTLGN